MHGIGNASVLSPDACDGFYFDAGGDYAKTGMASFFRDFQVVGTNSADSPYRAFVVNFAARTKDRVSGVNFQNIYVANFGIGVYARGLWFTTIESCHFYNCYHGVYFIGENVNNSVLNCSFNRADIRGVGGAWGVSFQTADGESTQSTRILSSQIYYYDILINANLAFELQIEHCDLSAAQSVGVNIGATIGGLWVRDCWIETTNKSATVGIQVANVSLSSYTLVHLVGNHLNCDTACRGSVGISVGFGNSGIVVNENAVIGFDQAITLGACSHLICKFNRVSCVTEVYNRSSHAILLDSLASDCEIGPNEILLGKPQQARASAGGEESS